ncbi:hypothetical protein A2U01_0016830, partial [Trifolium medium]|nr:hypothetical protein [Trifolium medium]
YYSQQQMYHAQPARRKGIDVRISSYKVKGFAKNFWWINNLLQDIRFCRL